MSDTPRGPGSAETTPAPGITEDTGAAVDAAVAVFSRGGFSTTKLSAVAEESGMSKRMLHYHFGDKRGLYRAAIVHAVTDLVPPPEVLNRSYTVPVEGMRRFVDAMFHRFLQNPDAARLVIRESLDPVLEKGAALEIEGVSEVILHIERLLLLGQDSGAFRPGISADDILLMVCSLFMFRESNSGIARRLTRVDLRTQRNIEGLRRMAIDTVLAFLTSNIPGSGYGSYVEPSAAPAQTPAVTDEVYDVDGGIY